jgi:hypothetical protein
MRLDAADIESPVEDWGKLLGDTAAITAARPSSAPRARAQMRAAQLAHKSADRLAHRGRDEVELPWLGHSGEIAGFGF